MTQQPAIVPLTDEVARQRFRTRLALSRHASELFWRQGVSATTGEQIAAAAGISVRTLWRYVRTKESCVEPLLAAAATRLMAGIAAWPLDVALEEHLASWLGAPDLTPHEIADDVLALRIVSLARTDPALHAAWLSVCAQAEADFVRVFAARLGVDPTDLDVRVHGAAAAAATRTVHEEIAAGAREGFPAIGTDAVVALLGRAIRGATQDRLCDAVAPPIEPQHAAGHRTTPQDPTRKGR